MFVGIATVAKLMFIRIPSPTTCLVVNTCVRFYGMFVCGTVDYSGNCYNGFVIQRLGFARL